MSYLCVDGGQTKTAVMLLDENGGEIEGWRAGPLTTPWRPGAMDNLRAVVRSISEELSRRLATSSAPHAACFSLTGYHEGDERIPLLISEEMGGIDAVYTVPDYVGNWAAATGGKPGVVVIGGGGSIAYGRNASGDALRVGGWGHLLGDEGSGFWIGLQAVKAALKSHAGVIPETALAEGVMREFGAEDDRRIIRDVYSASFSEARIAGLAPLVARLSDGGDDTATRILNEAAGHLAEIVRTVLTGLGDLPVYPSGGVFKMPTMRERFERALARSGGAEVVAVADEDPLRGVYLIASRKLEG